MGFDRIVRTSATKPDPDSGPPAITERHPGGNGRAKEKADEKAEDNDRADGEVSPVSLGSHCDGDLCGLRGLKACPPPK